MQVSVCPSGDFVVTGKSRRGFGPFSGPHTAQSFSVAAPTGVPAEASAGVTSLVCAVDPFSCGFFRLSFVQGLQTLVCPSYVSAVPRELREWLRHPTVLAGLLGLSGGLRLLDCLLRYFRPICVLGHISARRGSWTGAPWGISMVFAFGGTITTGFADPERPRSKRTPAPVSPPRAP